MRKLVMTNLGLNGRGHGSADLGNHDKATVLVDLRAAEGSVWRHNPLHRMAVVLDLRHAALLHGQPTLVGMIVDGRWRNDRMDCRLLSIHGHALHPQEIGNGIGARAQHRQVRISLLLPSGRRRNLCCMRQTESRPNPTLSVSSSFVTEFFEQAHAMSCRRRSPKCALLGPNVDD